MRRVERVSDTLLNVGGNSVDSNRFYSILLDARAASASDSMYDIAEKLLHSEKDNAKLALDQLWALKKSLVDDSACGTIDLLISYYQEKIDVLRDKEENIKKVSKDTRCLIEEKRKRDEEIASVKSQISDCTRELSELTSKLDSLKKREEELLFIESHLKKEINANEGQIVNGLYEIILHQAEKAAESPFVGDQNSTAAIEVEQVKAPLPEEASPVQNVLPAQPIPSQEEADAGAQEPVIQVSEPSVYPKSVLKNGAGRIIGEYFYDREVYKDERHYIYNSRFFSDRLCSDVKILKLKFNQNIYADLIKMAEDAANRVKDSNRFHFEVSTNEIINHRNLKQLAQDLKRRAFDDAERFGNRLRAKIDALGTNYETMLQEQMQRCIKSR